MSCSIITYETFDRAAKKLAKRYNSFKADLARLFARLERHPDDGVNLGGGLRKVRMAVSSKGRGKSGGARVITLTVVASCDETTVGLLYVYDKSDRENITDAKASRAAQKECSFVATRK